VVRVVYKFQNTQRSLRVGSRANFPTWFHFCNPVYSVNVDADDDAVCRNCVMDCRDADARSPQATLPHQGSNYHVLEFRLVALPSGISANQDLLRLVVYDQDNHVVTRTTFNLIADDPDTSPNAPFGIRTERGKGVVYTLRALPDRQSYQLKVEGMAFDPPGLTVLYHTTFIIYISVASYPY